MVIAPNVPVSLLKHLFYIRLILPLKGSSDRERLEAHSEILALQQRLGLSYKDAAHRLYMAELEKVKRDKMMYKAFSNLEKSIKKTLEMSLKSIGEIEGTQE